MGIAVCLIVARTSGEGIEEVAEKASLFCCMLMTPSWPGSSRDHKTSAVWALFCAWPPWNILAQRNYGRVTELKGTW
jgi:hypothetical protein